MFGISELAILLIVVILILGAKKLPELARSMGKSARILKSEAKAMKSDPGPASPATADAPSAVPLAGRVIKAAPGDATGHLVPQPGNDTPRT
ncbi:twin-arginine translocase TatA/TatE family subunit [Streptomyces gobitricini]|uniref:Sec-independent protein translocase protein TatA n=1 Tax=Streptomyces gobitricini TaxID=68211 RepID=A0ABN3M505_9ACTN